MPPTSLPPQTGVTQYLQLASILRHQIAHGERAAGERLPTVAELAGSYGVARITARQAYGVLAGEGLITSQRGRGTFVTARPRTIDGKLRSAINDPRAQDLRFEVLAQCSNVTLPATLVRGAGIYDSYALVRKVHVQDGEPFCLAEIHIASAIHRRFPEGSERMRKIAWLLGEYAPESMHKVQQTTTIVQADPALAQHLGCSLATPLAHMVRRILDGQGRIALAGLFWYRGDRFVADVEIPFDVWVNYPGVILPDTLAIRP